MSTETDSTTSTNGREPSKRLLAHLAAIGKAGGFATVAAIRDALGDQFNPITLKIARDSGLARRINQPEEGTSAGTIEYGLTLKGWNMLPAPEVPILDVDAYLRLSNVARQGVRLAASRRVGAEAELAAALFAAEAASVVVAACEQAASLTFNSYESAVEGDLLAASITEIHDAAGNVLWSEEEPDANDTAEDVERWETLGGLVDDGRVRNLLATLATLDDRYRGDGKTLEFATYLKR